MEGQFQNLKELHNLYFLLVLAVLKMEDQSFEGLPVSQHFQK